MTTIQRAFPLLTGLGVAAALLLIRWFPPPRQFAFVLFPIAVAVLLVVLTTWRFARPPVPRLAAVRGFVAFAAVGAATGIGLVASSFSGGLRFLSRSSPTVETTPEFTAVVVSVGSLAGWLAFLFERLAERRGIARPSVPPRRSPGLGMAAGVTIFLVAATGPAWGFAVLPWVYPGSGPTGGIIILYAVAVGIVGVVSLVLGVVAEVVRAFRNRPRGEV
ncbi:MAG TPA: hypothetical protein VJP78_13965 [Thermoleophilia bacterium]|nr:hypothetical protein [Thermoleophilia bacterium]